MNVAFSGAGAVTAGTNKGESKPTQLIEQVDVTAWADASFITLTHGADKDRMRKVSIWSSAGVKQWIAPTGAGSFKVEALTDTTTKITNSSGGVFAGRIILALM